MQERTAGGRAKRVLSTCLVAVFSLVSGRAQQAQPATPHPVQRPRLPHPQPAQPDSTTATSPDTATEDAPLPGDWAPELLDGILSSPNADARDALLDAAFAAGPGIIPQLEASLKDDRTAEFAAQSLAFIGGPQALPILARLMSDPRDLGLKRFYYGAMGEFPSSQANQVLFYALDHADTEPDHMVTESALIALTVRSDASLIPELRQREAKIKDFVIHDDLDNAIEVIRARARYLASPQATKAGGSVDQAVRTYFMPALEPPAGAAPAPKAAVAKVNSHGAGSARADSAQRGKPGSRPSSTASKSTAKPSPRSDSDAPPVKIDMRHLTFSPNGERALARVVLDTPAAMAYYSIVLQKQAGDWTVASVWLGSEVEKPGTGAAPSEQ
ncbi:MAG TPA: HEAT repeat domain-containing protein [Terriglobia bacterium]|nr:HEAT repeat domain-containing protein [Terriglobia bacterium]